MLFHSAVRGASRLGDWVNTRRTIDHSDIKLDDKNSFSTSICASFQFAANLLASYFRRDLIAGLTVAAVAVPQAMAYASIFGMQFSWDCIRPS